MTIYLIYDTVGEPGESRDFVKCVYRSAAQADSHLRRYPKCWLEEHEVIRLQVPQGKPQPVVVYPAAPPLRYNKILPLEETLSND